MEAVIVKSLPPTQPHEGHGGWELTVCQAVTSPCFLWHRGAFMRALWTVTYSSCDTAEPEANRSLVREVLGQCAAGKHESSCVSRGSDRRGCCSVEITEEGLRFYPGSLVWIRTAWFVQKNVLRWFSGSMSEGCTCHSRKSLCANEVFKTYRFYAQNTVVTPARHSFTQAAGTQPTLLI